MTKKASLLRRKRSPPKPLRQEFRDYARAAILDAGEAVLAERGLHLARMEEVASQARVAVGTIYNLIGDRDALVVEILALRHRELLKLMAATVDGVRPLAVRDQLHGLLVALLGYFHEHGRFFRLVSESERGAASPHRRQSQETLSEIRRQYRELVARGVKQRALRAEGRALYPGLLMGMMREMVLEALETGSAHGAEDRAEQIVDLFMLGASVR
ncbi:MAG TPA: TetR/AcrR family transcriptional regulator [Polyangiales bacterium]